MKSRRPVIIDPVSQLQGDSAPTKLMETGDIVHLALWSPLLRRTRCGISFMVGDERVEEPISCMTCLVRADVFEIPLQADEPTVNHFDEHCWLKQVHGQPCGYGYITECCFEEDPCNYHKPVEPLPSR